jgi:hypothetical protein
MERNNSERYEACADFCFIAALHCALLMNHTPKNCVANCAGERENKGVRLRK